jgi:FAD:protein FMN transferase
MRCGNRPFAGSLVILASLLAIAQPASLRALEDFSSVHLQRYCMGTMFDIVIYHGSKSDAERAAAEAMAEIFRLDRVLSHYQPDSDLSRLVRAAPRDFVAVEPSLFAVIETALATSRVSGGRFDITIAPLLKVWKDAHAEGRTPSAPQIAAARRCVGFDKIDTRPPNFIAFRSDCLELDLGGIGKGYAVEQAMRVLSAAGMRHALINAGGSSIAAIGSPPGRTGWPVSVGTEAASRTLLLRDASISTSQQNLVTTGLDATQFGEIIDPSSGAPASSSIAVRVVAPSAMLSDALSTALLMMTTEDGAKLLGQYPHVSAIWTSAAGEVIGAYRESQLRFAESR